MSEKKVVKKDTMVSLISDYLRLNGVSKTKDICEYVMSLRPTSTPNSISVTLYGNKKLFIKKGYGMWDVCNGSLNQNECEIIRKMSILLDHYKKKIDENGINGDGRLAGIDFTEKEREHIERCKTRYGEKKV